MNLAQVIHQRWAAAEELHSLLPAGRVFTGWSVDPQVPYAVISQRSGSLAGPAGAEILRYNDGSAAEAVELRIEVFDEDYDRAAAVIAQSKAAFDNTSFDLAGSDKVILMRRSTEAEEQTADGSWRLAIDFRLTVYLAAGR